MAEMKRLAEKYPWIVKWGELVYSAKFFTDRKPLADTIRDNLLRADKDNAPENAIYKHRSKWHTTDGITNEDTRIKLGLSLQEK